MSERKYTERNKSFIQYALMEKIDYLNWITDIYVFEVPEDIETVEDMGYASKLLTNVINAYTFIASIKCYISAMKREYKRSMDCNEKGSEEYLKFKKLYEDFCDKEDFTEQKMKCLDAVKGGISRKITIKQEKNKELQLLGNVC